MAAIALGLYVVVGFHEGLLYDRDAILSGQIWRLVSGHFVHLSASHLVLDVLALCALGFLIEPEGGGLLRALLWLSPLALSGLLLLDSGSPRFAGLSGIVSALVVYVGLDGLGERGWWRWVCAGLLVSFVAKVSFELATGVTAFARGGFPPAPRCHVAGAVVGGGILVLVNVFGRTYEMRHGDSNVTRT